MIDRRWGREVVDHVVSGIDDRRWHLGPTSPWGSLAVVVGDHCPMIVSAPEAEDSISRAFTLANKIKEEGPDLPFKWGRRGTTDQPITTMDNACYTNSSHSEAQKSRKRLKPHQGE
ncbi:hypothetical protein Nepgr_018474 [Nepenthes gracilis]|uniref:Uncharacterized protein n=1 Tax=Nepenthes gracilis TaxID=150966 RepID=A0AAD3XTF8_NEPGR|nr:hypothetical protein Nepgr_018474 [Nepenthes gracilis]